MRLLEKSTSSFLILKASDILIPVAYKSLKRHGMHIRHDFGVGLESSTSSIAANIRLISSCVYTLCTHMEYMCLTVSWVGEERNIQYPDGTDISETESTANACDMMLRQM